MSEITLTYPDEKQAEQQLIPIVQRAQEIRIRSVEEHEQAQVCLADLAKLRKNVEQMWAFPKRKAHETHKSICDAEARLVRPIKEAESRLSAFIVAWEKHQRKIAEDEARRLAIEQAKREEEAKLNLAVEMEKLGADDATVMQIITDPSEPAYVTIQPDLASVSGVHSRTTWRAEVVDKMALIRYVAANPGHASLLEPAMPALNALARSLRTGLAVPGVRAVAETQKVTRG